jgi:hypothetical protein
MLTQIEIDMYQINKLIANLKEIVGGGCQNHSIYRCHFT